MSSTKFKNIEDSAIIVANDLRSGRSVFFDVNGQWTESVSQAMLIRSDEDAKEKLLLAEQSEAQDDVIAPYLVGTTSQGLPSHIRELIRVQGPSISFNAVAG